jgi:hypothetical protein
MSKFLGRRRWGLSGGASLLAHSVLAGCAAIVFMPRYRLIAGAGQGREIADTITGIEIAEAAEAPPPAPTLTPTPVTSEPERPIAVRVGVQVHRAPRARPRPAPAAVQAPTSPEPAPEPDDLPAPDPFEKEATPVAAAGDSMHATVSVRALTSEQPAPQQTVEIGASEARYLRTYEAFPSLPRSLWAFGRTYAVLTQVCVSAEGTVSGVSIRDGSAPELERVITSTVRSWRYRPRMVEGAARPFCHLMKFVYTTR